MAFVSNFKKVLLAIALLGLVSTHGTFAAQSVATTAEKPIDIVFDLDDTLIRWIRPHEQAPANFIPIDGEALLHNYRIFSGAPELLQSLANRPNVRISFFSLGSAARNKAVLKSIILPDGRTALDVAYKILSDTDASENHEKDLTRFNPDVAQVLIVDDKVKTTIAGQEQNVIRIFPKVEHFHTTIDEKWTKEGAIHSTTPEIFVQLQNKLAFAEGILSETFERMEKDRLSPLEAAIQVQYSTDRNGTLSYKENLINDLRFYRKGALDFHKINPAYHFTGVYTPEQKTRDLRALNAQIRCVSKAITGK